MRLKVGKCVIRHNGKEYGENDVFDVSDNDGAFILANADAEETELPVTSDAGSKDETPIQDKAKDGINTESLTEEQINGMKQGDLAKVARALSLETPDKKADTLRRAISEALGFSDEDVINLDEMDEAGLRELAEAEGIEVPDDADEETLREIIEKAFEEE